MSANVYVSTQTDVYFVDTTNQAGTITLPSTNTSAGYFLTFKDAMGTFSQSTITFRTINPAETFEDGTTEKTLNDQFGAYTFISDSNKWYLTGGPHMDSAVISTINYQTVNYDSLQVNEILTSSVLLLPSTSLYSEKGSLFFGSTPSNAWGGAKTANALTLEPGGPVSFVSRMVASSSNQLEVTVGANSYTVHAFYAVSSLGSQPFTVTTPGFAELIVVGGGGNGGITGTGSGAGGGGGGGEVLDYTGNPLYFGPGTYQVFIPLNNLSSTVVQGPGMRIVARNGSNGGNGGLGGGGRGGTSGNGLYLGGSFEQNRAGGGAGASENGYDATVSQGGTGGSGVAVTNYFSGIPSTIWVAGGGGGGGAGANQAGLGGLGGGGNGCFGLPSGVRSLRLNGTYFGGGGGGAQGTGFNPGDGGTGAVWIRYTYFSTIYS